MAESQIRQSGSTPPGFSADDLEFAITVARYAGEMMRAGVGADATLKVDGTPVTRIDKLINDMVAEAVAARGERMLGEEDEQHVAVQAGRVWVCDPIDGTWLFTARVPGSVFSLALVEDGNPILGVVYDPWTGRLFRAVIGEGAFVDDRPLRVNTATEVAGCCLVLPGGRVDAFDAARLFAAAIEQNADVVIIGSAVHDAVLVPLGFAAATVYPYTSPWDMAAVALLVSEAGGRITDLRGLLQRYDGPIHGAVISNGLVHDQVLAMVRSAAPVVE